HERLVAWRGGLVSVRVVHPRLDVLSQFAAVAEGEIIGEDVAVMQETEPAVRGFADADLEEIVPPAIEHVELVAVVRARARIPPGLARVGPREFDREWQDRMHEVVTSDRALSRLSRPSR